MEEQLGTWTEIFSGFVKVGTVPIERIDDSNGNGVLDAGEDWDGDGVLDVVEPKFVAEDGAQMASITVDVNPHDDIQASVLNGIAIRDDNGEYLEKIKVSESAGDWHQANISSDLIMTVTDILMSTEITNVMVQVAVTNIISDLLSGKGFPDIDWALIASLSALVAISGSGGLSNTPISNYTRDEGWGMGHHVGASPPWLADWRFHFHTKGLSLTRTHLVPCRVGSVGLST